MPKSTVIHVHDGLAEVIRSSTGVEIMDFDVTPGADEELCTCGDHGSDNKPHSHTTIDPNDSTG